MRFVPPWLTVGLLLLPALGCGEDTDDPKGDDTAEGDADTDADTDTDTDTDTGVNTGPGAFTFLVEGSLEELSFGLQRMDPAATSFEELEQGMVVTDATFEIELAVPDLATMGIFDEAEPEVHGQVWMAVLFRDPDADAVKVAPTDYYTSLGEVVLIYLDGPLGQTLQDAGFQSGWNARRFRPGLGIDYEQYVPNTDIQLHQNTLPTLSLRLEGDYELSTDSALVGIMVTAPEDLNDGKFVTVADRPITEKNGIWGMNLSASPPPSHRGLRKLDDDAAVEMVHAYLVGESGFFESTDQILGLACDDDSPLFVVHMPTTTDPTVGLRYLSKNLRTGWSLYVGQGSDPMERADPEVALAASISNDCRRAD